MNIYYIYPIDWLSSFMQELINPMGRTEDHRIYSTDLLIFKHHCSITNTPSQSL